LLRRAGASLGRARSMLPGGNQRDIADHSSFRNYRRSETTGPTGTDI
jgi:hypothetical protein